ncbi:MAG TPA: PfkB family carbohydrate kinase, partial [Pedobacter sp.]
MLNLKMHQVVCFGEILWDNFKTGRKPGGAPMNVALHLYKQGQQVKLISAIGNDVEGGELASYLKEQGLLVEHIQIHQTLPTGIVEVILDEIQQATYNIVRPVAWDEINYQSDFENLIGNAHVLVFGSLACRNELSYATLLKLLNAS